jgi:hypothetical protein
MLSAINRHAWRAFARRERPAILDSHGARVNAQRLILILVMQSSGMLPNAPPLGTYCPAFPSRRGVTMSQIKLGKHEFWVGFKT